MDDVLQVYPIEVLHVVNPHVIFVEARDSAKALVIEQIGIYGIVPANQTIDIDGRVVVERSENWPAVATTVITQFLAEHQVQSYFMPIRDECRSSIFNNNSIKFGYIFVKSGNQVISLNDHLVKYFVAEQNEVLFHQRLSSGSLKLKLSYVRSEEILKAIRQYYIQQKRDDREWREALDRQTTLHQESMNIASKLTAKNLELLQRKQEKQFNVMEVIDRKARDFDLCKDADDISVGYGTRRHKTAPKENYSKVDDDENSPSYVLKQIKNLVAAKATIKSHPNDNNQNLINDFRSVNNCDTEKQNPNDVSIDEWDDDVQEPCNTFDNSVRSIHRKFEVKTNEDNTVKDFMEVKSKLSQTKKKYGDSNDGDSEPTSNLDKNARGSKSQANLKKLKKTPERLIAFGPPSNDLSCFKIQKAKEEYLPPYSSKSKEKDTKIEIITCDDGTQEDSNVNLKISNAEKLKNIHNSSGSCHKFYNQVDTHLSKQNHETIEKVIENNSVSQKPESLPKNNSHTKSTPEKRTYTAPTDKRLLKLLQRRSRAQKTEFDYSLSSNSDTSVKDTSSSCKDITNDEDDIEIIKNKLKSQYKPLKIDIEQKPISNLNIPKVERNVNPFKNLDGSKSVFVDKLVAPILMVHTKNDNLVLPQCNLRDVPFKTDIHIALKNMNFKEPYRLQTVSWNSILRGHSFFMVGPAGGGKTIGYIPAVCNLVMDSPNTASLGPICIIVCATAASVSSIEGHCKRFLGLDEVVLACYAGIDMTTFIPTLLNGCHILVCTAAMLYRLLGTDLGVDLRRLTTLVFEDGERLSEVYGSEIKVILHHVKDMLKNRADTSWKVQYVVASRLWCDFMTPLAKYAPDTVIAISAFQECVPYSKTNTSVQFVIKDNKVKAVLDFLDEIDSSKSTVIVCRSDDEVKLILSQLNERNHAVFSCNNTMTVHDLYNLSVAWNNYREPVLGPILICCDGNLTHLNVTNAHYLVHFSMPELFSMFCKRFAVLNENYASIFGTQNQNVKIKILLEESNAEQLPKILNFIKRCTNQVFPMLSDITKEVLEQKDLTKAKHLVPICNTLLSLGECADSWNCRERHAILQDLDEPKPWMPTEGIITFKIMHYSSAVTYSARILSNVKKSSVVKYPNNFNKLSLKMGMYYSKESNRKPQGIIKLGDICAIAVKPNFYERCQVVKILSYSKGNPHIIRVNLIDEEKLEDTRDIYLYYLPDEFKNIETHVAKVRLANVQPQDKDVTFSALAESELRKITENDENLYLRGEIVMTIGNCIFLDSLEACQDLSSLGETVVKYDFKKELLSRHAEPNPQHIPKLEKLGGVAAKIEHKVEVTTPTKIVKPPKWAHLDKNDFSIVIFAAAEDAGYFFVRLEKFQKVINSLVNDIQKIVESSEELPENEIYVGNIVLAEFPDDKTYERARIDSVITRDKVKCFFVDNGDWREVSVKCLRPIPDNILHRVPFQVIECRLVGVKPPSDEWTEFGTNWLYNNCFETSEGNTKYLFAKYFTKEEATTTGGHKYGIVLIDTSTENDVIINKKMIELNLARENEAESEFLNQPLDAKSLRVTDSSSDNDYSQEQTKITEKTVKDLIALPAAHNSESQNDNNSVLRQILFEKPIRSVPLVQDSDASDSDISVHLDKELMKLFKIGAVPKPATETNELINNNNLKEKLNNAVTSVQPELDKGTGSEISKATRVESQTDSDDFEIGRERVRALTNLKDHLRSEDVPENVNNSKNLNDNAKNDFGNIASNINDLDSDDLSSVMSCQNNSSFMEMKDKSSNVIEVIDPPRKPKLIWRQNKSSVSIKIQLIGVENYNLDIKEKSIKFNAYHNDTNYEFEFELYGVVNVKKCRHSSKGQYILVVLTKIVQRNWLNLAKDCTVKNWMSYDVDAIDSSSDEEVCPHDDVLKVIKKSYEHEDTDSEDDDFVDDANFGYEKWDN